MDAATCLLINGEAGAQTQPVVDSSHKARDETFAVSYVGKHSSKIHIHVRIPSRSQSKQTKLPSHAKAGASGATANGRMSRGAHQCTDYLGIHRYAPAVPQMILRTTIHGSFVP